MVALAIALASLLVIRPIMTKLTQAPSLAELTAVEANRRRTDLAVIDGMGGVSAVGAASSEGMAEGDVELREGETLEELKARMKPKKKGISADMLDTANSYDDKVTVVRMMVSQDSKRVSLVLKNLIGRDLG